MNSPKRKYAFWVALPILLLAILGVSLLYSTYGLTVTNYSVTADIETPIRIAHLTDLHNHSFGTDNEELIARVAEQQPDLILISGDLIISSEDDLSIAVDLLRALTAIAPVCCSLGNHELEYEQRTGVDPASVYTQAGAMVLDKDYVDLLVNGQAVRIGGIYGYCLSERFQTHDEEEVAFLREFEDSDAYKILLAHLPYSWTDYGMSADYAVDLVLTGHSHGGQIRLPFIGAIYEPELKWFPGQCAGVYQDSGTTTILSRGLGSANEKLPRLNNVPELVVVDLLPA